MSTMSEAMVNKSGAMNKGKGNVKALTKSIPKPTGSMKPGKSVSKKAAGPSQPVGNVKQGVTRTVRLDHIASADKAHTVDGIRGHLSYKA